MAVVINEFEVVPEAPAPQRGATDKSSDEKGSEKPAMSDHEVKKMLERRAERLERISAR